MLQHAILCDVIVDKLWEPFTDDKQLQFLWKHFHDSRDLPKIFFNSPRMISQWSSFEHWRWTIRVNYRSARRALMTDRPRHKRLHDWWWKDYSGLHCYNLDVRDLEETSHGNTIAHYSSLFCDRILSRANTRSSFFSSLFYSVRENHHLLAQLRAATFSPFKRRRMQLETVEHAPLELGH